MRIMLQFPEGLKKEALAEAGRLEKEGHDVFLSGAQCFGACDLCLEEAKLARADRIIHFGHAEFLKAGGRFEVEYRPYFAQVDEKKSDGALREGITLLKEGKAKKVALVFPIQHLENAKRAGEAIEAAGIEVAFGKGGAHVRHQGQVLGCDSNAANVPHSDAVVYFGGGKFHPTGIVANKPVMCIDPHLGKSYWITEEIRKAERKRAGALLAASQAKTFGVLLSTKIGQRNLAGAKAAKRKIGEMGRVAQILVANEFSPIALANFMAFDAYVNTACPRISDDGELFGKPIVNYADLKRLLELMV